MPKETCQLCPNPVDVVATIMASPVTPKGGNALVEAVGEEEHTQTIKLCAGCASFVLGAMGATPNQGAAQ